MFEVRFFYPYGTILFIYSKTYQPSSPPLSISTFFLTLYAFFSFKLLTSPRPHFNKPDNRWRATTPPSKHSQIKHKTMLTVFSASVEYNDNLTFMCTCKTWIYPPCSDNHSSKINISLQNALTLSPSSTFDIISFSTRKASSGNSISSQPWPT